MVQQKASQEQIKMKEEFDHKMYNMQTDLNKNFYHKVEEYDHKIINLEKDLNKNFNHKIEVLS